MRLFFGILPDRDTLTYIRDLNRQFDSQKRNLRQVPPEQLHLTIRFVGAKVSDQTKNIIVSELKGMSGNLPKPEMKITKVAFGFARQHDPRVLFAEVNPNPELEALQIHINNIIKSYAFFDVIRWKPTTDKHFHISFARLKPAATRSTGKEVKSILEKVQIEKPAPFIADSLVAVQSIITDEGKLRYQILDRIPL